MPFPNPDTQFKPGQSGNPAGPPKGYKKMKTRLLEILAKDDNEFKVLQALVEKAQKPDGDMARKEILDRIDGKVTQEVEQKTEHSGGIRITWEEPNLGQGEGSTGEL